MAYPPRAFYSEKYVEVKGKKEPIMTFGEFDHVFPIPRKANSEKYKFAEEVIKELGYRTEDFDKETARIYKEGVKDPTFCDTSILVGLVKRTISSDVQADLKWSIEHAFEISDHKRAARNIAIAAKQQEQ